MMKMLNEVDKLVLSLIEEKMSINDISYLLQLNYQTIYDCVAKLKMHGFNILEKYYDNGNIGYYLSKSTSLSNKYKNTIITRSDENEFDLMLLSDYHLGSFYETGKLIEEIYDYCAKRNIHIVLNLGDFVEGVVNLQNTKVPWDEQIYHALKNHPMCNDILTFMLFGNHDHSLLVNFGLDIRTVIKNMRGDIIPLGFGFSKVNIKDDEIIMEHPLGNNKNQHGSFSNKIILRGHGHESKIICDGNNYIFKLPSLSNLNFNKSNFPGASLMHLKMSKGNIIYVTLEELSIINNKIYTVNETKVFTGRGKDYSDSKIISNEEDYQKILRKVK